jgi:hypothetical protein
MNRLPDSPRITVLGLHSAAAEQCADLIRGEMQYMDDQFMSDLGGRISIEEGLRAELSAAVLVEVLVENADDRFKGEDFIHPWPGQSHGEGPMAYLLTYYSADGEVALSDSDSGLGDPYPPVPSDRAFRAAFYIQYWQPGQPLLSSYGPLTYPELSPPPARLWKTVPYVPMD